MAAGRAGDLENKGTRVKKRGWGHEEAKNTGEAKRLKISNKAQHEKVAREPDKLPWGKL